MTGEEAVRLYLLFLQDPESLRDESLIEKANAAVESAKDPLEKLLAIADRTRALQVDGSRFRQDFVSRAKAYADEQDIPASAFLEIGVPEDDLREAGFELRGGTGGRRRGASVGGRTYTERTAARRSRTSASSVRDAALGMPKVFTLAELEKKTGASTGTVRKVIADLVGEKKIEDLGSDPEYKGRGRAPKLYEAI